jgi:hypothetical protein
LVILVSLLEIRLRKLSKQKKQVRGSASKEGQDDVMKDRHTYQGREEEEQSSKETPPLESPGMGRTLFVRDRRIGSHWGPPRTKGHHVEINPPNNLGSKTL